MRLFTPIGRTAWKCSCRVCDGINLFLALIAVHLTFLILLNSLERVIPLPDLMTRWAVEHAIGKEYHADWSRAVFDLRGGFYLENISIRDRNTQDMVLKAESARVNWAIWHLLTGVNPPIDQLDLQDISLYLPPGYSPSGLNEPAVAILNLSIEERDRTLFVHDLQVQVGGVSMNLTGSGALGDAETASNTGDLLPRIYGVIGQILRFSPDFKALLTVDWQHLDGSDQRLSVRFVLPVLKTPAARFSRIDGLAALAFSRLKIHHYRMECSGYLEDLVSGDQAGILSGIEIPQALPVSMSATGKPVSIGAVPLPSDIVVSLSSPAQPIHFLNLLRLSTSLEADQPVIHALFKGPHLFATADAFPEVPHQGNLLALLQSPLSANLNLRLKNPSLDYFYPDFPKVRRLMDTQAATLRLQARLSTSPLALDGLLFADRFRVGATDFEYLKTRIHVDPRNLRLNKAHVQISRNEFAEGGYSHHFPDSRFYLLARGRTFPQTLDSLLGKWWIKIFTNLQATSPAYGDVAVWGQWSDPTTIKHITGAHGENAVYRGCTIPDIRVRVRSDHDWVVMDRLEGFFGDHRILGKIAWKMRHDPEVRNPMLLDFKSVGPWEAVVAASGLRRLDEITIEGNPEVSARGVVWNAPKNHRHRGVLPILEIQLHAYDGSFRTRDLVLDNLRLVGRTDRNQVHFDAASGIFADGVFTGTFSINNWSDSSTATRHLKFHILDCEYRDAVYQLAGFLENPEGIRTALLKDTTRGRAEADLDLLLSPDLNTCTGHGRVTIRKANIGEIHLFGGLSRSLNNMGLGFSSLDLNAATLEWNLANSVFEIAQCTITGPVLNLDVMGDINLLAQQIALQAKVTLFRGLASAVFAPVGDSLQFDLSGNLENPSWQTRLNPFRWFRNRLSTSP